MLHKQKLKECQKQYKDHKRECNQKSEIEYFQGQFNRLYFNNYQNNLPFNFHKFDNDAFFWQQLLK